MERTLRDHNEPCEHGVPNGNHHLVADGGLWSCPGGREVTIYEAAAEALTLLSIVQHAVREELASWIPWCAVHDEQLDSCHQNEYCRLEEPARHIVLEVD